MFGNPVGRLWCDICSAHGISLQVFLVDDETGYTLHCCNLCWEILEKYYHCFSDGLLVSHRRMPLSFIQSRVLLMED